MTYPTDERGLYQVEARWIEAWGGGGAGHAPGFAKYELRRYEDGTARIHRGQSVSVTNVSPAVADLHQIYMAARDSLLRQAP